MAIGKITKKRVDELRPGPRATFLWDEKLSGFGVKVTPNGKKVYIVQFRCGGRGAKTQRMTLGRHGSPLAPDQARKMADDILAAVRKGIDPVAERAAKLAAERAAKADTVEVVVTKWLMRDQAKNRTHDDVQRLFDRNVLPHWRTRPITSITRADCLELVDRVADRGAATQARRLHAYLHRMLRWAVGRGIIETNPLSGIEKQGKEVTRSRVLSDTELIELWRACGAIGWPLGPAIHLLMLTGARRAEIGELHWPEIDGDVIRLAGERTKTGEPRTLPLSPLALSIVADLPRIKPAKGAPEYVFTTTGETPVSGWSRAKARLDAAMVDARRAAAEAAGDDPQAVEALPPWRLHDLRRTVATGLQRLGFRLEVIEAVLGHVSGSRAGIVGVYQRHSFDDEKRRALDAWADHVAALVEGRAAGNVVPLRDAG